MLTQNQIQASFNINTLLDTATDCLRFVTEFFEVISQSAPHIYHCTLSYPPFINCLETVWPIHLLPNTKGHNWDACLMGFMYSKYWN